MGIRKWVDSSRFELPTVTELIPSSWKEITNIPASDTEQSQLSQRAHKEMVPITGIEPMTNWLQSSCSTYWAKSAEVVEVGIEPTILITALGRTVYLLTSHLHSCGLHCSHEFRLLDYTHLLRMYRDSPNHYNAIHSYALYLQVSGSFTLSTQPTQLWIVPINR